MITIWLDVISDVLTVNVDMYVLKIIVRRYMVYFRL